MAVVLLGVLMLAQNDQFVDGSRNIMDRPQDGLGCASMRVDLDSRVYDRIAMAVVVMGTTFTSSSRTGACC